MGLADYQSDLVDKIYKLLTEDDVDKGITLYGDAGSGKSTIAINIANQLQENWAIFYIGGVDTSISPYLTWHIGTKLYHKSKTTFEGNVSFGISFLPMPISFELGGSFQRTSRNYILTPSEEAIVVEIQKQAGSNNHILIIADSYDLWDLPSRQLLHKIALPQLKLLDGYHTTVMIVSNERISFESKLSWSSFAINDISDDGILTVLQLNGYSDKLDINKIRCCSGNDLSLALMAASYYTSDIPITSYNEIMDIRCNSLSEGDSEVCKILEPLSIIDSYFTKDETAFFIDPVPQDEEQTQYRAEEFLMIAEELQFLSGYENYCFSNEKIKAYFRKRLANREKYYHRKFASFLQRYHPEDYYSRGKHLMYSLQLNDSKRIFETWQLLFLAYIRRSSEFGNTDDVYHILNDIASLLERINAEFAQKQQLVLTEFLAGYKEFSNYNYKEALLHLQAITPSQLVPASLTECLRLILLSHVQLAENQFSIMQTAEELYDIIESTGYYEDEQYCRAALVLLDVYIDRINDAQRARILKRKLIQILQHHPGQPAFDEFEACYNRKAALYYTAAIACRQTEQSVKFYREHHNKNGLYMALCNHSGNAIISGAYSIADRALIECERLISDSKEWYYPSQYKVRNNRVLLNYLCETSECNGTSSQFLLAGQKAIANLAEIKELQKDETSYVVLLNQVGLSMLCGGKAWPDELSTANLLLADADGYYQYFLHDLNFADALLREDYTAAQNEYDIMKSLDVPLLRDYKQIFNKRQQAQAQLLNTRVRVCGDPIKYHNAIVAECSHVQDPSCRFWGRGFLLSDLQFLSF